MSSLKFSLGLFYFFYFALVGVYVIFLPKALVEVGFSGSEVGIIFAIAPIVRFALPFIFRRFGNLNKKTYLLSLFLMVISAAAFFVGARSFWALVVINIFYGASMGVILPFVDTIALKAIKKENYGKVRLWGSIGFMAIALWLGKFLQTPTQTIYYLIFMAIATGVSGLFIIKFDSADKVEDKKSKDRLSLSQYWAWWLSALLFQVSFGGFYNFFTIYETNYGVSLEITSWLWSFGVVCEIVMLYFQGALLKRFSLLALIEISIFSAVIRWLILWAFPGSLVGAFISQAFHSLNFALYYSASIAYVYTLYSQKKLAQQFFLGISFGLGGSIGAVIAGFIYQNSPNLLFLSQALISLLAFLAILIHKKRVKFG